MTRELLNLSGGTGDLLRLLTRYQQMLKQYQHRPLLNPVIVLIDNDDGASKILPALSKEIGTKVDLKSNDPFYRWSNNLYIVKTPSLGADETSCIESFFDPALLLEKLSGKTFQPKQPINPATEYGKAAFAENVVLPKAGAIDFSGFAQIFERVVAVLSDYKAPAALPTSVAAVSGPAAA
jgi:RNA-directed DNA polymerase